MNRGLSGARKPQGLMLRALRSPLWLYRRNLGILLGKRFLYLAHQGRLSGLRHETVLEVVRLDHETGEAIVIAVWGNRADWVRNIRAGRALEIRIGHLSFAEPEHRFLTPDECREALEDYRDAYPMGWQLITRLFAVPRDPSKDDLGHLRAVAFRPPTLPE